MLSLDFLDDVRRMNKRQLYYQVLNFGMIVSSALMIWKGLMVITGSESPIVVVLSGSMEPAFHRGDLLFLTNRVEDPIRVGEIVVFRIEGREIPIVHRVLKIHEKQNGHIKFLTKGDNNAVDDRGLYKQGQHWLEKKDVVGRARGFVPYIGIVTILMNDYPKFKGPRRPLACCASLTDEMMSLGAPQVSLGAVVGAVNAGCDRRLGWSINELVRAVPRVPGSPAEVRANTKFSACSLSPLRNLNQLDVCTWRW
uniref:Signal peptidase complex catalytic subunit SEC11 n=1 Tax=Ailuropoda melanoleuca TaxID=9646 RepID=A0A7N5JIA0_AILME